ncbi:hypothetical protein [Motiliproteus sp. SC1-56]|uniref:hypothetical protein n=1 Tax=Motiliproteus sp. SC1-56 TaxID=2799565 RepID=UPI001A8CD5FB|nr:hypothetical protein [Motiliproteus sp. SC1-56]
MLYIYYSVHLVEDPVTSTGTYHVGDRLSASWYPKNHDAAVNEAKRILPELERYAFPWFDKIDSAEKFEGAWFDYGKSAAFAAVAMGELDRAKIYLEDAIAKKAPLIYDSGYPGWRDNEYGVEEEEITKLQEALEAIKSGTIETWREKARQEKFTEVGIG